MLVAKESRGECPGMELRPKGWSLIGLWVVPLGISLRIIALPKTRDVLEMLARDAGVEKKVED